MHIFRPVQKLYPIQVKSTFQATNQIVSIREPRELARRNPRRSAALNSSWKTKQMLDL